jgi:hypothetical protein
MQGLTSRNAHSGGGHFSTEVETFVKMRRTRYAQPGRRGVNDTFYSPPRTGNLLGPAKAGTGVTNNVRSPRRCFQTL